MTWMIESIRDADVAPADVFRLYTDPSTWRVGLRCWAPHERFDRDACGPTPSAGSRCGSRCPYRLADTCPSPTVRAAS